VAEDHSPYKSPNSHDHWGEETGYRRIHWAAMTAVAFTAMAPLAIYISGLVIIPIVGFIFGAYGYWHIKRKPDIYTGQRLATIALFLTVVFALWSAINRYNSDKYLYEQAATQTRVWLKYIKEGQLGHAHQVMLQVQNRNMEIGDIEELYRNNRGMLEEQQARFERQPIKMMLEHSDRWKPEELIVHSNISLRGTKKNEIQLIQQYILPLEGNSNESIAFTIQYWRQIFPESRASHWQIEGIGMLDESFNFAPADTHAEHNH
tara:strand:- start:438 stop:1223 length:786 start_codon:yes stop_codon:yes gene_type:complete